MERISIVLLLAIGVLVIASAGGSYFAVLQSTSAQMMAGPNMINRYMTQMMPGMMPLMKGENVTGSINLMSTISNAIASQVKVSLSEAATSAENNVGNDSHVVAAHIGGENGYLFYTVCVFDPNGKLHRIIIDPADGKILLARELSDTESMIMHL
jgi:hypothetical protein